MAQELQKSKWMWYIVQSMQAGQRLIESPVTGSCYLLDANEKMSQMAKDDVRHLVERGIIERVGREDDGAGYWVYSFTPGCEYGQVKNPVKDLETAVQEFYRRTRHVPERWFIVAELTGANRPKELVSVHQDFTSAMGAYGEHRPGQCGVFRKAANNALELVF